MQKDNKQVKLYRLKTKFYDGFKWDIVIAATGMDWVTMWITHQNGHLIEEMSIVEFSELDLWVDSGFSISKMDDETIPDFCSRVLKQKGN